MRIDPATLPIADRYKLLIGGILPRPIAWVSTVSRDGRQNLAPFSFFAGVGSNPMTLLFCPANKPDGSDKDTLRNLLPETDGGVGAFVVNTAPHRLARPMAACAEELPYGESEFEFAGVRPEAIAGFPVPRVKESPLSFACRTLQVIRTNPRAPSGGNVVLGAVEVIVAEEGVVDAAHHVDPARLDSVGRMAGLNYCTTRDRFEIPWGKAALGDPGA
jgi:flavin reductase (DIM6/NTAB) family NADH-FMN oxidoreductase RutF